MDGLEDAWPLLYYFLHTYGISVVYFRSQIEFNLLISFLQQNSLSVVGRTNYSYPLIWLPNNQFIQFLINTLLCIAMVNMLAMYIIQNVCLCAADCNLGYMNKTLFTLNAFEYLIYTFKVKRSAKNTKFFLET